MDRRFEPRREALLDECQVSPYVFRGMLDRLENFVEPFASILWRSEQSEHALNYVSGLISDLKRKNSEAIAYRNDQDRRRLQHFIGESQWDHEPLMMELARQVGEELGEEDGVISFDPSAFAKKGSESVGTQRQWCGRLGKIENCQVGVYMGYASSKGHVLVDTRLYLPKEWAKNRARRKKSKVPKRIRFQTRHQLSLEMLDAKGTILPHAWITGDDEMGRSSAFRRDLRQRKEAYMLAVPSNTLVRDLEVDAPSYSGKGRKPVTPFVRVDRWQKAQPKNAWTRIDVRDGEKGPIVVDVLKCRVVAKTDRRRIGPEETLVVVRSLDEQRKEKLDYYLSWSHEETSLQEYGRVCTAHHRVEECIKWGKSEAGLADYQVRNWHAWHHHQTLSLIACWFLVHETRRGKKNNSSDDGTSNSRRHCSLVARCLPAGQSGANRTRTNTPTRAKPTRTLLLLENA